MKTALFSLAALSPILIADAVAFPTGQNLTLTVEGNRVATINARNRVVDDGDKCLYTLQVTLTSPPLGSTVRCDISETKASNFFDCEQNRQGWIDSLIQRRSGCTMFDEFGQRTSVPTLIGGESSRGVAGIFVAATIGDVQSFTIR